MTPTTDDPQAGLRRGVYLLLIALGTGAMLGRIMAVDAVDQRALEKSRIDKTIAEKTALLEERGLEPKKLQRVIEKEEARIRRLLRLRRPFLSANDRSRWCMIRAIVEEDMRVEDVPYAIDKVIAEPTWDTIDMVKHHGHLYSSKPPLFPTLVAGEYWLIHRLTGATLGTHPYAVGRFMLVTINVIPLIIYFLLLARLIERFGTSDWGRIFVMGAATFGTFLTTFGVVINNHLPAAVCAMVTLYALVRIWFDDRRELRYFFIAGLFAAFTVANELPAACLLAAVGAALLWRAPRQTVLAFLPGVLLVAAGFFGTNWIAHQSLRPAYMHRGEGDNWYDYTYQRNGKQYESYWNNRVGVDRGEPSPGIYALHVLVGHHGIFSLTPVWLLSVAGLAIWLFGPERRPRELALLIGALSLICIVFYLARPLGDRNYGGMTCGLRWLFWFAPMWLVAMLPAADVMGRRGWTRGLALLLLVVSAASATYPTWNPWVHPWLLNYLQYLGWVSV